MTHPTMSNSDFIELCKSQNIQSPYVLGFYFNPPIPNFKPPMVTQSGLPDSTYPQYISTCCFSCAYEDYFPKNLDQIRKDLGLVEGNIEDEIFLNNNKNYFFNTFPKDQLNLGIIIPCNESSLEAFDYEWQCDICDSMSIY